MTFRYAGFWLRLIATLIDWLVLMLACWLLELPLPSSMNGMLLQEIDTVLYTVLVLLYFGYGQVKFQTSLGKRALHLYVVRADNGLPLTLRQSLLRCLGFALSYLPLGWGYIMVVFDPRKRALHDLLAGSIVVREVSKASAARSGR